MANGNTAVEDFSSMVLNTVTKDEIEVQSEDVTLGVKSIAVEGAKEEQKEQRRISAKEWKDLLAKMEMELAYLKREIKFIESYNKSDDDHVLFDSVLAYYGVAVNMCTASCDGVKEILKENKETRFNTTDEYIRWQYVCTDKESAVPSSTLKKFDVFDPIVKKFKSMKPEELSSFTRYALKRL